jgi:hypothetical protein
MLLKDHLTCRMGGYDFLFRSEFFSDNTRVRIFIFLSHKARNFFPQLSIRLYDKNSESDFFFHHQNQNIFFSNIGIQNILKYSDFGGGKKNLIQSFCHIT